MNLVDRAWEIEALDTWWDRVCHERHSATLVVDAPAGMGKTSLVEYWVKLRSQAGSFALQARADEFASAPLDPIRWAIEDLNPFTLPAEARESRERCLAVLHATDSSSPAKPASQVVIDFLQAAAQGQPAIVVLDDIHVADGDTLQLCTELARTVQVPVFLIVMLRPNRGRSSIGFEGFLERLAYAGKAHRISLRPLGIDGIGELLRSTYHQEIGPTDLQALLDLTQGNPLFVRLSVESLDPRTVPDLDSVTASGSPQSTPARLEVLRRYIDAESTQAHVGARLAVFGRFLWDNLAAFSEVCDLSPSHTQSALESLRDRGVLTQTPTGLAFAHPLIQEAFATLLPAGIAHQVHLGLARAQSQEDPDSLFKAAVHLTAAGDPNTDEQVDTLFRAASSTMWVSPAPAANWFSQVRRSPASSMDLRAQALASEITSLLYAGRSAEAWALCQQAFQVVPPHQRGGPLLDATCSMAFATGNLHKAVDILKEVPIEQHTAAAVAIATNCALLVGRRAEALKYYQQGYAEIRRAPDSYPALALLHLLAAAVMLGRSDEIGPIRHVCETRANDAPPVERTMILTAIDMQAPHVPLALRQPLVDVEPETERVSVGGGREINRCLEWFLNGEWDQLLSRAPALLELLRASGNTLALTMPAACAAMVAIEREQWSTAAHFLDQVEVHEDRFQGPLLATARGRLAVAAGETHRGLEIFAADIRAGRDAGVLSFHTVLADYYSAQLLNLGDRTGAAQVATQAVKFVRQFHSPLLDAHGLLALARATREVPAAKAASRAARRGGLVLSAARCDTLLGSLGDDPTVRLQRAHRTFNRLGALAEQRLCLDAMETQGVAPTLDSVKNLSTIESTIVRQLVQGRTNKQIAQRLHYSPKTIEMHLSRIYARTGRVGRVELVRAVADGKIVLEMEEPSS